MKLYNNILFIKKLTLYVSILTSVLLLGGCYYDKEEILYPGSGAAVDCSTVQSAFSADVLPLITSKCAISGCHNAAGASGGVVLESYNQVNQKKDRVNARALVEKSMPPTGPLSPAEAAKIRCWLDAGAQNN